MARRKWPTRPKVIRGIALSLLPLPALLIAIPIAMMPWQNPGGPRPTQLSLASPIYIGLICAPGYIYVAFVRPRGQQLPAGTKWWLRISLLLSAVCSLGGIAGGLMMVLFAPPSLLALGAALYLLWDFEKKVRVAEGVPTQESGESLES